MARVRLYLDPAKGGAVFRFVRPGGVPGGLPSLWLRAYARMVPLVRPGGRDALSAGLPYCIVDTGAPLSILPEYIWSHFRRGAVAHLAFDPAMPAQHRFVTVGGGRYSYNLAELDVQLIDHHGGGMTVRVVAQLTRDGGALTIPMVLGLSGGFLDGRVLRAEPDPAAPFGQAWALEDP